MKRKELIIFAVIFAAAICALLVMNFMNTDSEKRVHITVDGDEYKNIPLDNDTNMSFTIYSDVGTNNVVIADGHVDVISADCPTQICVHTKSASKINDIIVCLPHKVVIEIIGTNTWANKEEE